MHIEEFFEYGGKAVCSNHVFNFKIGKWPFLFFSLSSVPFETHTLVRSQGAILTV